MSCYNIGNFKAFCEENASKFANCTYKYYEEKCKKIIKELFFGEEITEEEKAFVKKHTNTSAEEWKILSEKFNELDIEIIEEFMDPENMPYAP